MNATYRGALQLLRERVATRDAAVIGDARFALARLLESNDETLPVQGQPLLPDGRRNAMLDLQTRVEAAQSTVHDPDVIAALLDALTTFLNEELNEIKGEDNTMATDGETPTDETTAEPGAETPPAEQQAPDAGEEKPAAAADAAGAGEDKDKPAFLKKGNGEEDEDDEAAVKESAPESGVPAPNADKALPSTGKRMMQCEACGYHMEVEAMPMTMGADTPPAAEEDPAAAAPAADASTPAPDDGEGEDDEEAKPTSATRESAAQEERTMTDPAPVTAPADPAPVATTQASADAATVQMTEADRQELVQLRQAERRRTALQEARKMIKEAGVFITPEELITFDKAQWPAMIRVAQQPPRTYGTGQRAVAPLAGNQPMRESGSASDYYSQVMGR